MPKRTDFFWCVLIAIFGLVVSACCSTLQADGIDAPIGVCQLVDQATTAGQEDKLHFLELAERHIREYGLPGDDRTELSHSFDRLIRTLGPIPMSLKDYESDRSLQVSYNCFMQAVGLCILSQCKTIDELTEIVSATKSDIAKGQFSAIIKDIERGDLYRLAGLKWSSKYAITRVLVRECDSNIGYMALQELRRHTRYITKNHIPDDWNVWLADLIENSNDDRIKLESLHLLSAVNRYSDEAVKLCEKLVASPDCSETIRILAGIYLEKSRYKP